jgi:hypothetical protein
MALLMIDTEIISSILNDKYLDQIMLSMVNKEINTIVNKLKMLNKIAKYANKNHKILMNDIVSIIPLFNCYTIHYLDVEWYIEDKGWPPNTPDIIY